jgi:adenylosuccinate lyase
LLERDISNSAPERIIFKDSAHIACFTLDRLTYVIKDLNILSENAESNINSFKGLVSSQEKMNDLIKEGRSRKESHDISQKGDN